jgi:accessory gene regulator protein AgrB
VAGNNLLKPQLVISAAAAVIVIGGIFLLVPRFGIVRGGAALVAGELAATNAYKFIAQKWMRNNGLAWPKKPSVIASSSVFFAGVAMILIIMFNNVKWLILGVSLLVLLWNMIRYWKALPLVATQRVSRIFLKLPLINKIFTN